MDYITLFRNDGTFEMATPIPDTITNWIGNSLCTHPEAGVGVTEITEVTAFQPFFLSFTLPYSAVRGEVVPVLVTVFNYLSDCIAVSNIPVFLLAVYITIFGSSRGSGSSTGDRV